MLGLSAFLAREVFGIALAYVIAGGLALAGGYLVFVIGPAPFGIAMLGAPFRYLGKALIVIAAALALVTFGKGLGVRACTAAAHEAALRAEITRLKGEAALKDAASLSALTSMQNLAGLQSGLQHETDAYAAAARDLPACRRATGDDDRRMRDIIGAHAPAR